MPGTEPVPAANDHLNVCTRESLLQVTRAANGRLMLIRPVRRLFVHQGLGAVVLIDAQIAQLGADQNMQQGACGKAAGAVMVSRGTESAWQNRDLICMTPVRQ